MESDRADSRLLCRAAVVPISRVPRVDVACTGRESFSLGFLVRSRDGSDVGRRGVFHVSLCRVCVDNSFMNLCNVIVKISAKACAQSIQLYM